MRRLLWVWLLAGAVWAIPTVTTPIEISSIAPKSVSMLPGGSTTVRFFGRGFESIASAQILRQDVRIRSFEASWTIVNPNTMEMTLKAAKDLPPAGDYRLVLFTRRWSLWVPLRIELLDPSKPAPEPLFPDPTPQPSGWFNAPLPRS